MKQYNIRIEIADGEVKEILDELSKAQETIYKCYNRLECLGVVTVKEKTSAAANDNKTA